MLTLRIAAKQLNISLNDLKIHIGRGNIKTTGGKIPLMAIHGIRKALPNFPKVKVITNHLTCFWLWHEGEYTSILAQSETEARTKFSRGENKDKEVYAVWAV